MKRGTSTISGEFGKVMKNKITRDFSKLMTKKKVPCLQIGIMEGVKDSFYLEVIIKRPERYNSALLKRVPKEFEGFKVKVV